MLKLTVDIINQAYVEKISPPFIDTFIQVIHKNFWDDFEKNKFIKKVFATNPNVTKLLITHTNESDIHYILDLLRNFNSLPESEFSDDFKDKRIDKLISYFEINSQALEEKPASIRPLINLILSDLSNDRFVKDLPKPNCLPNLGDSDQSLYWHFLGKRLPFEKEEHEHLIRLLENYQEENVRFIEDIYCSLIYLPPHIPLKYITKQLDLLLGKNFFEEGRIKLEQIKDAAEIFNKFLYERKIIASLEKYEKPLLQESYDYYLKIFEENDLNKIKLFFKVAINYPEVSDEHLKILIDAFFYNKLQAKDDLETAFKLFQMLPLFPENKRILLEGLYVNSLNKDSTPLHLTFHFLNQLKDYNIDNIEIIFGIFFNWEKKMAVMYNGLQIVLKAQNCL